MSLTREFLSSLKLEGDTVDKIMAEVGKDKALSANATELQKQVDDLKGEKETLASQVK